MKNETSDILFIARKLMMYIRQQERTVSDIEKEELWRCIEKQVVVKNRRKSRYYIYSIVVASSVAAVLLCLFWLKNPSVPCSIDDSIMDFAKYTQAQEISEGGIVLLMPGKEEIEVGETDASIIYSQNGTVTINSDTVHQVEERVKEVEYNQLIIPKGKRTRLMLPDGTHLWVNAGTRVIYPNCFENNYREIYVEGEVYLDVYHDEKAPFIVKTKDFQVQVLGTSFNISAYPSQDVSSVVLVKGSVNIKNQEKKQVKLTPGQMVDIRTGQLDIPKSVDVEPYVCWVKNMLMYKDESLDKVFQKLNLYYGEEFILDSDIKDLLVSGKLDLKEKLEDVLYTISYSVPICYEKSEKGIIVRKKVD